MLSKKVFMRSYTLLLTGKGIALDKTAARLTYEAFKNDYTDNTFQAACLKIFKKENFYGRVPDASLFAKYTPKNAATEDFITRCFGYLGSGYVPSSEKEAFLRSLTSEEARALDNLGGISHMWSLCHSYGVYQPQKAAAIIARLRQALAAAEPVLSLTNDAKTALLSH